VRIDLIRNFTGPKARPRFGPDVFADSLVPFAGKRARLLISIPKNSAGSSTVIRPGIFCVRPMQALPAEASRGSRTLQERRDRSAQGSTVQTVRHAMRDRPDPALPSMVIVSRNATVNQIRRMRGNRCGTGISCIPYQGVSPPRLHPVHRDT
jgi:hypothetical protein